MGNIILGTNQQVWDRSQITVCELIASGTKKMHQNLDHVAAVDATGGIVTIPCTGHGYAAGSMIGIRGSTNYNGVYEIVAVDTDTFNVYADYVAETFINTETVRPEVAPGVPFRIIESRLQLSAAGGAAENYTITLDSAHGAAFDAALIAQDMTTATQLLTDWGEKFKVFNSGDIVYYGYANSNSKTWGLEVKYEILNR